MARLFFRNRALNVAITVWHRWSDPRFQLEAAFSLCHYFKAGLSAKNRHVTDDVRSSNTGTLDIQRYMADPPLETCDDPLAYENKQKIFTHRCYASKAIHVYTVLTVPCERVFAKAGGIVSKKTKPIQSKNGGNILFLNKNIWIPVRVTFGYWIFRSKWVLKKKKSLQTIVADHSTCF